jgi:hypothetical protein
MSGVLPFCERACRRDGIAMAVKAKRTSLSSLVRMAPKMTPPISPELPVYARVSGAALCFRRRLLFYCALMPLCQVAFCSIVTGAKCAMANKGNFL